MATRGIYGLSGSGIDVESLVKVGMMSRQKRYDRMYQKEVEATWKKEAYAKVYDKVQAFRNNTVSNFRLSSATKPMNATSTNAGAVTATATANAGVMPHSVTVTSVASNAYLMTAPGAITRANTGAPNSIKLKDVAFSGGTMPGGMTATDTALSFKISDGTGTKTITFTADEVFNKNLTLNDLAARINNARYQSGGQSKPLNIRANYDSVSDGFSLFNSKTGDTNKIELSVDTAGLSPAASTASEGVINKLRLGQVSGGSVGPAMTYTLLGTPMSVQGTNANVTIDGRNYNNLQENNLTVNDVIYTFKQTTGGTPAQINITQDQDKLVDNVKKFVEEYNALLDELVKLYGENKYKDYGVLTKSQEEGMSKEKVEKWNEKAKSGLLFRDSYVRSLIGDLRDAVINRVGSAPGHYKTLSSIGITSADQTGHLKLDEAKLKAAIAAEPDAVKNLLSHDDADNDYSNNGVASRLANSLSSRLQTLEKLGGGSDDPRDMSTLGKLIQNYQKQMSDFKKMMDIFEQNLYKKYDAMEVAISRLSTQYNFFVAK